MSFRRNRTFLAAWLTPLLVALAALALPASSMAVGPGAISGTVSGEGAGGLAGIEVCAWSRSEVEAKAEEDWGCATSTAGGGYTISGLPADEYTVEFWPAEQNYVWQYYAGVQDWEAATPVVVAGTTKSGIDATLAKGAQIKGRVTAATTGLAVAGVEVCAAQSPEGAYRCALTESSGNYTIVGLAGGTYRVYFYPERTETGLLGQAWNGHELIETGDSFTVAAASIKEGVNAALRPGGQIDGTVRLAATNAPLAGVRVCLSEAAFLESLGCTTTTASGAYRFIGAWAASFKVVFSAEPKDLVNDEAPIIDAYPTLWWNGQSTFAAATPIQMTPPETVSGIDAALGPPPVITTPPAPAPVIPTVVPKKVLKKTTPAPKCRKGLVKRKVHGKPRCVRPHKAAKHKRHKKKSG